MVGGFIGLFTFLFLASLIYTEEDGLDKIGPAFRLVLQVIAVMFVIALCMAGMK